MARGLRKGAFLMKRSGLVILMLAGSVAAACADVLPAPAPVAYAPPPSPVFNWSGFYIGVMGGYGLSERATVNGIVTTGNHIKGGFAGGTIGFNYQPVGSMFVIGAEADLSLSDARDTFAPWKFSNPWFGTLRGRAGFALNRVLLYGTLGFALGCGDADVTGSTVSRTHVGWTAGGGMEVGLTPNWSARVEYLFVDLADRPYAVTGVSNGFESSLLRFGINYRF